MLTDPMNTLAWAAKSALKNIQTAVKTERTPTAKDLASCARALEIIRQIPGVIETTETASVDAPSEIDVLAAAVQARLDDSVSNLI
jgi:hypothetical protein